MIYSLQTSRVRSACKASSRNIWSTMKNVFENFIRERTHVPG